MIGDMIEATGLFGQGPSDPMEVERRKAAEKMRIVRLKNNIAWLKAEIDKAAEHWDFITMERYEEELKIAEKSLQRLLCE